MAEYANSVSLLFDASFMLHLPLDVFNSIFGQGLSAGDDLHFSEFGAFFNSKTDWDLVRGLDSDVFEKES